MLADGGPAGPRPSGPPPVKYNEATIEEWKKSVERIRAKGEGSWGDVTIHTAPTSDSNRADPPVHPTTAAVSQSLSGLPGVGDISPDRAGSEGGVWALAEPDPTGIPKNALLGKGVDIGGELGARTGSTRERVRGKKNATGLDISGAAFDSALGDGSDHKH
jgi:hypothetical protein